MYAKFSNQGRMEDIRFNQIKTIIWNTNIREIIKKIPPGFLYQRCLNSKDVNTTIEKY
jgi:hypothetical protein